MSQDNPLHQADHQPLHDTKGPDDNAFHPLVKVRKVFDNGKHNAFTTLAEWKGRLYLAFRTAKSHANPSDPEGVVTLLTSHDSGATWEPLATFYGPLGKDLRDPKLLATRERLYLFCFEYQSPDRRDAMVTWTDDGKHFSAVQRAISKPNYVIWWPVYEKGTFYAAGYRYSGQKQDIRSTLFQSDDGVVWSPMSMVLDVPWSNESALVFDDEGGVIVLVRNDGDRLNPPASDGRPVIAHSGPPFSNWKYSKIDRHLKGMALLRVKEGLFIAARDHGQNPTKTACFLIPTKDLNRGSIMTPRHLLTLPSGGDTSYAGFVKDGRRITMSYYSSHEYLGHDAPVPSCIYVATFNLDDVLK